MTNRPSIPTGAHGEPTDLRFARWKTPWGEVIATSHVGLKRSNNEDRCGVSQDLRTIAVLDGMGGHEFGAEAAEAALIGLTRGMGSDDDSVAALRVGVVAAAEAAKKVAEINPEITSKPGCTMVAVRFDPSGRHGALAWAGDSRIYAFSGGALRRLTADHAIEGTNVVTRCLGGGMEVSSGMAEYAGLVVAPGTILLLSTDGLHGNDILNDRVIEQTLQASGFSEETLRRLVGLTFAEGAPDNVTILLARVS